MPKAVLTRKHSVSEDLSRIVDCMPGAALVCRVTGDGDGKILYANQELLRLYGCKDRKELSELSGGSYIGLVYPDDAESVKSSVAEHAKTFLSEDTGGKNGGRKNDRIFRMRHRIRTKDQRILEAVEIARYTREPELGKLVYSLVLCPSPGLMDGEKDFLTGLPNMRAFLDHAQKTADRNRSENMLRPVTYIYFNLSHFKRYNMRHGLEDGDRFLRRVSEILVRAFPGDFIARLGADQFAVLTLGDGFEEQIEQAHEEVAKISPEFTVELKAGIYRADMQKTDIAANVACDLAKIACDSINANPSLHVRRYDEKLAQKIEKQEYIRENIDRAIDNGWIKVYYQPVVRSLSGALCGFEALTRWDDPTYGLMNPEVFVHTLEESHLIHKLDIYMVQQVCRRIQMETEAGRETVPVSFNLSRLDFVLCDCFEIIDQIVLSCHVPRAMVPVEITESTVMEDGKHMAEEIARFHNAGYQVCMDDFGSGYSSLNMLKDFRFDELKLDMEFLHSPTPKSLEIVASTVRMAKKLGMHTLAEGVETREQVEFLKSIGCEKMQGYYFGRPQPYEDAVRFCVEQKGLPVETREWSSFFDRLGMVNLQTDRPLLVVDIRNSGDLELIYANKPSEQLAHDMGYDSLRQLLKTIRESQSETSEKIRAFLKHIDWTSGPGEEHTLYLTESGHFLSLTFSCIVSAEGHHAFTIFLEELCREE